MKKQFDRFILTEQMAQGVGGALFLGEERLPGGVSRPVQVKVLPAFAKANPAAEARFFEEVKILVALAAQPHVVTFYGVGVAENVPWIALEHVPDTLASLLGQAPASISDVRRLIEHVARGLGALHALQPPRLHNRLNPANVLLCPGRHFKITEFGLAAPVTAEPMLSADSVRYAAPELVSGEAGRPGPATDLYALGHLAYELALGAKLHRQQFPAVVEGSADLATVSPAKWQAWHHSLPTNVSPAHEVVRGFPPGLSEVIARLMVKQVGARYGSADEVLADLERMSDSLPAAGPGMPAHAMPIPAPVAGGSSGQ